MTKKNRNSLYKKEIFHGNPEIQLMTGQKSEYKNEEKVPKGEIPVHQLKKIEKAKNDELKWIWFGHSSSLLQIEGKNVLMDPVFSNYTSPIPFIGPKRFTKLPIDIEKVPSIDVLAISHDYYDHLDYQTIKQIDKKVKEYCVPLGVEKHLLRWGIDENKIHVMNWWDEVKIDGLTIISTPGRHFTGRVPWRNNTTLWSGYVFKNNKYTTYFTGDTGYGNHFKEVYEKFGDIDLLMIEDGQYDKSWSNIHMLPKDGIQAMKDLHAKWTVPVHWGAFCICNHAWDDPIKQITTRSQKENLNVATPKIGEIVDYSHIETYQEHWWENVE